MSDTHRAWRTPRPKVRDVASPIVVGNYLFAIDMKGTATTYDARSGKVLWSEQIPTAPSASPDPAPASKRRIVKGFTASPIESGGLIYLNTEAGETLVIRPGPKLDLVTRNSIGEHPDELFRASIAPINGRIYLRSNRALYCVGAK